MSPNGYSDSFYAEDLTADNDRKNQAVIEQARAQGRINDEAAAYLSELYSDSIKWFREVFYFLGKCFGAPKAPVMRYDYATDSAIDEPIKVSDINPLSPYIIVWTPIPCVTSFLPVVQGTKSIWLCHP